MNPVLGKLPTNGTFAALGAGNSVGKRVTDTYRQIGWVSVLSVPVGKQGTDGKTRTGVGFAPFVGMSLRIKG